MVSTNTPWWRQIIGQKCISSSGMFLLSSLSPEYERYTLSRVYTSLAKTKRNTSKGEFNRKTSAIVLVVCFALFVCFCLIDLFSFFVIWLIDWLINWLFVCFVLFCFSGGNYELLPNTRDIINTRMHTIQDAITIQYW